MDKERIIAFVGMPGSGKSEASSYLKDRGIPFLRFGDLTDEEVINLGIDLTPDNERMVREKLRRELGMAAYAIKAEPKIEELLVENSTIGIDGLYSWEEYIYLKERFPNLILVHIYAEPQLRYERLSQRPARPVPYSKSRERDMMEIENLNKGGPIAIADYMIENDGEIREMTEKIDVLLNRIDDGR
jgi:dephospho-CoA kinase